MEEGIKDLTTIEHFQTPLAEKFPSCHVIGIKLGLQHFGLQDKMDRFAVEISKIFVFSAH